MNNAEIAERLVAARGQTPRHVVCNATGISLSALAMYETGKRIPKDEIKVKLSKYYGIPVQDLFY